MFDAASHGFAPRNGTGLLVTAGIHVALGAALLSLGIVEVPGRIATGPIKLVKVPDAEPSAPPAEPEFRTVDVVPPIYAPPILIVDPEPPLPRLTTTTALPPDIPIRAMPPGDLAPAAPPAAPVTVAPRLDPRFAARFQPPYPSASERLDEEGTVLLRVRVGADGRVLAAEVIGSSGHARLDRAAAEHALRAWRFVPATRDGMAIEGWKEIPVRFELRNG